MEALIAEREAIPARKSRTATARRFGGRSQTIKEMDNPGHRTNPRKGLRTETGCSVKEGKSDCKRIFGKIGRFVKIER